MIHAAVIRASIMITWIFMLFITSQMAQAKGQNWSLNEVHFQYGSLKNTAFTGGGADDNFIVTWNHASLWQGLETFVFVDHISRKGAGSDIYMEAYTGMGLKSLTGTPLSFGPVKDIGPRIGLNWGAKTNIRKHLLGLRVAWEVPHFVYFNTDFFAFLDASSGAASGGVPKQSDSWQADLNWATRNIRIGEARFSLVGHMEYTGARTNEFGAPVSWTFLAQPQLRYDLGHALNGKANTLYVGVEGLIWLNKKGDPTTDEASMQALLVWRF